MTLAHALGAVLVRAAHDWWQHKDALKVALGVHDDVLHVAAGVLIQLAAALAFRRSLASPLPWLAVLAIELLNEASDLTLERWTDRNQFAEGAWDLAVTLALPTLVLLAARLLRLWRERTRAS